MIYKLILQVQSNNNGKKILLDARYGLLQTVAQKGAEILKTDFDAHKVWLFGSGLRRELIHMETMVSNG